ncbi:MAG: hypothetical protein WBF03_13765 [Xanthobacteraceae bacterium]
MRGADAWITGTNDEIDFGLYDSRCVVRKLIDAKPKAAIVDDLNPLDANALKIVVHV